MGFSTTREEIEILFAKFKDLADRKRTVTDRDLEALMGVSIAVDKPGMYKLDRFVINSGNTITATATVRLLKEGVPVEMVATGDGPVDAMFTAINRIVGVKFVLTDYNLRAVTEGNDAQGEALIKIRRDEDMFNGRGISTDVLEATASAYVNAINHMLEAAR
jgi:2-isopropylmalate synthase